MRHSAKSFHQRAAGPNACLEALEARLVLSAPTATPQAPPYINTNTINFSILYHSDVPLDPSTVGYNDIAVTGPGGVLQWARPISSEPLSNGDIVAGYALDAPAPTYRWDDTPNGTFNVSIAADAVRNTAGEGNAGGGVASYWFWFTPQVSLAQQRLMTGGGPGSAYWTLFWGSFASDDDTWFFQFDSATNYTTFAPGLVVRMTGPGGYDQTGWASELVGYRSMRPEGGLHRLSAGMPAPGGTWDFSDSGAYTVQVGTRDLGPGPPAIRDVLFTQTFTQNLVAPKAELVSSTFGVRDALITVRYTAAPGATINAASISEGDILAYFAVPYSPGTQINGTLLRAPTTNADGSVTAVFRVVSPNAEGWTGFGAASIRTSGEVTDSAGNAVGVGVIGTTDAGVDRPSVAGLRTLSAVVNAWDVELSFRNAGGVETTLTPGPVNLLVYADINGVFQLAPVNMQFVSSATSADKTLALRYRITPRQGFLWDGTYTLQLNPALTFNIPWGVEFMQAFAMHFAGPSVQGLRTLSRTNTSWDVELAFNNPGSLISTSSLSNQNLIVAAPGGRTMRISLLSFANGSDGVLRVRYRITPVTAGTALPRGAYGFSLRGGSVVAAGVALPGQFLANMTI